jgi:hypothetical protein
MFSRGTNPNSNPPIEDDKKKKKKSHRASSAAAKRRSTTVPFATSTTHSSPTPSNLASKFCLADARDAVKGRLLRRRARQGQARRCRHPGSKQPSKKSRRTKE